MSIQDDLPDWANIRPAPGSRRLPVYFLLDTSNNMKGAPIKAMQTGLEQFQCEILEDVFLREAIAVGVITFSDEARLITNGLIPISAFQTFPLTTAGDGKRLDLAFQMLLQSMERDVIKAVVGGQRGDWRPVVFVIIDGQPTDECGNMTDQLWTNVRKEIINRPKGQIKPSCIIAFGCGPNVDDATLQAISTGPAFRLEQAETSFVAFLHYLT